MASGKKLTGKKPVRRSKRSVKKQQKRRGPVMRFKFSRLVLIWVLSLIICFGAYLYKVNFHPDPEKTTDTESSAVVEESSLAEESSVYVPDSDESSQGDSLIDVSLAESEDEPAVPAGPKKINPVPGTVVSSHTPDYLDTCAFIGETNIYNLGLAGLLKAPYGYYASETLTLQNYQKEQVILKDGTSPEGTGIRVLSAIRSASCPIYLMFGTESLSTQGADETAEQFRIFMNDVQAAAPEAEIFVMSIPPVTLAAEKAEKPIKNAVIDEYNSKLLEICNEENVYFVDTNTALKDNNGRLDAHYAMEDGIHLTTEAGQILLNYVLTHIPE
ncbi:MAG: hypothetical protein IJ060_11090 [Oscillospiraceae bacterium]|nr:hypothetical protein [Oscillospiraceae bacterium]